MHVCVCLCVVIVDWENRNMWPVKVVRTEYVVVGLSYCWTLRT